PFGFTSPCRYTAAGAEASSSTAEAGALGGGTDSAMQMTRRVGLDVLSEDHSTCPRCIVTSSWTGLAVPEASGAELADFWFRSLRLAAEHPSGAGRGGQTPSGLSRVSLSRACID
ncbi:hypothetical protein VM98_35980, partial [Streptomyces rubellomurinus subsp. indigoferus]